MGLIVHEYGQGSTFMGLLLMLVDEHPLIALKWMYYCLQMIKVTLPLK